MRDNVRPWLNHWPQLGRRVYVDPAASVIGDVTLGDDTSIWPMAALRGDVNAIRVGARTSIQDCSVLHGTHDGPYSPGGYAVTVGDDVTVGHRVVLHGCAVGNRCLIGMGSVVMDGAVVGDEAIIGAGALVTPGTQCEPRSLYVGSPARRVRALSDREVDQLAYMADWYVKLKDQYL